MSTAPLVSMLLPFSRPVLPEWALSLRQILPPMNSTMRIERTRGMARDKAREYLIDLSLEKGSRFSFFLDDDVTVPPNVLRELIFQLDNAPDDVMVIGGIYCAKITPPVPLVYKKMSDGPFYKWQFGQVFECELIATGMMLIKNELFKHIEKPWFKEIQTVEEGKKYGLIPDDHEVVDFVINDDGFFCDKVRKAGFKILAHGGMLGVHWNSDGSQAFLLPNDSYPMKKALQKYYPEYNTDPQTEEECGTCVKQIMEMYKKVYGYIDLLPMDKDLAALVQG